MQSLSLAVVLCPPFWPGVPPLSLIHLSGFLAGRGYRPSVFDLNIQAFHQADARLKQEWMRGSGPELTARLPQMMHAERSAPVASAIEKISAHDIAGFSCYRANRPATRQIAQQVKCRNPRVTTVCGGPEIARIYFSAGHDGLRAAYPEADIFVVGEGEQALENVIRGARGQSLIVFDEMPEYPDFDYRFAYGQCDRTVYQRPDTVGMFVSRGCVRTCRFCAERLLYTRLRTRPVDSIIQEIAFHRACGVNNFVFHDSMLNADIAFLEQMCDAIIAAFGRIPWQAQIGIRRDMSPQLFAKMKASGAYHVFVGLESGSDTVLEMMRKGFTIADAGAFLRAAAAAGLSCGVSLIVGFPGETDRERRQTLSFLRAQQPVIAKIEQINPYVHYEGTDVPVDAGRDPEELQRISDAFIDKVRQMGFKMTRAYVNNLVGQD